MILEDLTTPFGGRGLSYGMVKGHQYAENCPDKAEAGKWQILRDLTIARHHFAISDRAVTVLSALLSFFPDDLLTAREDLLVFPSNAELMRRAHGISEATLRRSLHQLVESGLLLRRDSPNGKRYARRHADGTIAKAFGFDLKPLLGRALEIRHASADIRAQKQAYVALREDVTLLRRDIRKLLALAMEDGLTPAWAAITARFLPLDGSSNRGATATELQDLQRDLQQVRAEATKLLKMNDLSEIMNGNDLQNERHKHESNQTPPSDFELADEILNRGDPEANPSEAAVDGSEDFAPVGAAGILRARRKTDAAPPTRKPGRSKVPLDLVLRACPDIRGYAKQDIRSWHDLAAAAALVRSVLGVSPDAWAEAEASMGIENAATTIAFILQKAEQIRSPGGYLRSLSERAQNGGYSPAPVIEALLRH